MRPSLPLTFESRTVSSPDGAEIFVRSGGSGPVVVLLHGYAETSDSWAPLATELVKNYTVVVPDLRGIGRSSRPTGGYDKKTQAADIRAVVTALGHDRTSVVSHDIGIMVAYAYAHFIQTRLSNSSSWTPRSQASSPGIKSSETRHCGISTFTVRTQSDL